MCCSFGEKSIEKRKIDNTTLKKKNTSKLRIGTCSYGTIHVYHVHVCVYTHIYYVPGTVLIQDGMVKNTDGIGLFVYILFESPIYSRYSFDITRMPHISYLFRS